MSNQDEIKKPIALEVVIPDNLRAAVHANIVQVTTTINDEVMLDFVFSHPQEKKGGNNIGFVVSRIVLPIKVAKQLSMILGAHLGSSKNVDKI